MKLRAIFGIVSCLLSLIVLSGCGEKSKEKKASPSSLSSLSSSTSSLSPVSSSSSTEEKKMPDTWELEEVGRVTSKKSGINLPLLSGWEEFEGDDDDKNKKVGGIFLSNRLRGYRTVLYEFDCRYFAERDLQVLATAATEQIKKDQSDLRMIEEMSDCVIGNGIPAKRCKYSFGEETGIFMIHIFKTETGYVKLCQVAPDGTCSEKALPVFERIASGVQL